MARLGVDDFADWAEPLLKQLSPEERDAWRDLAVTLAPCLRATEHSSVEARGRKRGAVVAGGMVFAPKLATTALDCLAGLERALTAERRVVFDADGVGEVVAPIRILLNRPSKRDQLLEGFHLCRVLQMFIETKDETLRSPAVQTRVWRLLFLAFGPLIDELNTFVVLEALSRVPTYFRVALAAAKDDVPYLIAVCQGANAFFKVKYREFTDGLIDDPFRKPLAGFLTQHRDTHPALVGLAIELFACVIEGEVYPAPYARLAVELLELHPDNRLIAEGALHYIKSTVSCQTGDRYFDHAMIEFLPRVLERCPRHWHRAASLIVRTFGLLRENGDLTDDHTPPFLRACERFLQETRDGKTFAVVCIHYAACAGPNTTGVNLDMLLQAGARYVDEYTTMYRLFHSMVRVLEGEHRSLESGALTHSLRHSAGVPLVLDALARHQYSIPEGRQIDLFIHWLFDDWDSHIAYAATDAEGGVIPEREPLGKVLARVYYELL